MMSKMDIPLQGPSVNIVKQCGAALSDVLQSKFGCAATISGVDFERDWRSTPQKRPPVVLQKKCEFSLPSGVKLSVWKGDLTNIGVDAVVNAANDQLQHYGGLASALSNIGGPQIQHESDDYIKRHGSLKTGDAIVLKAGSLPCKNIIHAVGPQLSMHPSQHEVSQAEPQLKMVIKNILDRVKSHKMNRVAIPAISSGLFHYPLPECAHTIVTTVRDYYKNSFGHFPQEILLMNNDDPTVNEMERALCKIFKATLPATYSHAAQSKNKTQSSTLTVDTGNVHLTLKTGHIEQQRTDVIVNTTYNQNLNNGQISKVVLQKAGNKMQDEMYRAKKEGHIVITDPYNLRCKKVFHTFCVGKEHNNPLQILQRSISECLWMAVTKNFNSISFPAIGTGGLGFQKKEVAQIMTNEVASFALKTPKKMDVFFVIFPSDTETYEAFEEQMTHLQRGARDPYALEYSEDFPGSRAPTAKISLSAPSDVMIQEAERWLQSFFSSHGIVTIRNNFIIHFGEEEHRQLSRLMKRGVSIEEFFERGRASTIITGGSDEDVAVAGFQVEAMLCNIQRGFVMEEESAMSMMVSNNVSFERKPVEHYSPEGADRVNVIRDTGLQIVKVDRVENSALKMLFDLKAKQLGGPVRKRMFQCIPAHFCDMVCHIGFHAEFAPPDDPEFGEGIYFASTVKKLMDVWKEPDKEVVHLVEAEVLTGSSTPGKPGLFLPPTMSGKPEKMYDSVSGGSDISVIFCGYQALPVYIITCRKQK